MGTPAWSPDSRELLVSTFDEAARGHVPWAIQIDPESGEATGREPLRLPGSMGSVKAYAWSEDGSQIAISAEEGDSLRALWIVNRTGGAGRVTAYVSDTYGGLDWLPGGDRLVVTARLGDHARLFAVTPNTGRAAPLTPEGMNVILPEVSPDGRWIAATRIETTKDVLRIGLP